jgi:hypothetical protein
LNRQLERLRVGWTRRPATGPFKADSEPVKVSIERVPGD